jgi:dihydrofolate reductase
VLSNTKDKSDWNNSVFLTNVEDIKKLKDSEGSDLKVWGSGELVQLLLKHDLVDELWLKIYPVLLGKGKNIFSQETVPTTLEVIESTVTPSGVIFVNYKRAGEVKTGNMGA